MDAATRIRSRFARTFASERYLNFLRGKARLARRLRGHAAVVHYFHQVDDPYSHLVVQKLDRLRSAYRLPFEVHLVSKATAAYQGSPEHFDNWALRDALSIAADYGVTLHASGAPAAAAVQAANDGLAPHLQQDDFAEVAIATGAALWSGTPLQRAAGADGDRALREGNALRRRLGHYGGGMFHFDGEWFWGIDRIRLLERRLRDEGFGAAGADLCVPEPTPLDTAGLAAHQIVLEYFPSLRSPYTAIGHQRVLDLVARSGVSLALRPVMPMMMRGVPAPFAKQQYIIIDAAREARARNVPFGRIVDPLGEPVKRAFALFPGAVALGKGVEFVTAYLAAAWAEGVDIAAEAGLREVAIRAGIDWRALQQAAAGADWEALLDANLTAMLEAGLWGVPSFRVTGGSNAPPFACWGQDRIWRVENEIARRAASAA